MVQLYQVGVLVVGFVNENKFEVDGQVQLVWVQMLCDWCDVGYVLGNYIYLYMDLNVKGVVVFQQDFLCGEMVLWLLLVEQGQVLQWMCYFYLCVGCIVDECVQMDVFFKQYGYCVVLVMVDNGEWVWVFVYVNVMNEQVDLFVCVVMLVQLCKGYVLYMLNKLDYYEKQLQVLLGYVLLQVWLMYVNEFNVVIFVELVVVMKCRGYCFILLDEVMCDLVYVWGVEGYNGCYGLSWLYCWVMVENKLKDFYVGEFEVLVWVMKLVKVDLE